jgi:hypothetical protein
LKAAIGMTRRYLFQRSNRGPIQNLTTRPEAGTVTRAIPATSRRIPRNSTSQMGAHCGTLMQLACVIPINRDVRKLSANDRAHAWLDFLGRPPTSPGVIHVHIAQQHLDFLPRRARRLFRAGSCSVVQGLSRSKIKSVSSIPAMGKTCSRIACGEVHIELVSGISADERMNANPSTLCMTCPDHRNSGSFSPEKCLRPLSCEARKAVLPSAVSSCTAEVWIHLHSPLLQQPFRAT